MRDKDALSGFAWKSKDAVTFPIAQFYWKAAPAEHVFCWFKLPQKCQKVVCSSAGSQTLRIILRSGLLLYCVLKTPRAHSWDQQCQMMTDCHYWSFATMTRCPGCVLEHIFSLDGKRLHLFWILCNAQQCFNVQEFLIGQTDLKWLPWGQVVKNPQLAFSNTVFSKTNLQDVNHIKKNFWITTTTRKWQVSVEEMWCSHECTS